MTTLRQQVVEGLITYEAALEYQNRELQSLYDTNRKNCNTACVIKRMPPLDLPTQVDFQRMNFEQRETLLDEINRNIIRFGFQIAGSCKYIRLHWMTRFPEYSIPGSFDDYKDKHLYLVDCSGWLQPFGLKLSLPEDLGRYAFKVLDIPEPEIIAYIPNLSESRISSIRCQRHYILPENLQNFSGSQVDTLGYPSRAFLEIYDSEADVPQRRCDQSLGSCFKSR